MIVVLTTSRSGKPIIQAGMYRYRKHNSYKNSSHAKAIQYTMSRFGKPVLLLGSYRYNLSSKYNGVKKYWLCSRKSTGCKASIFTVQEEVLFTVSRCGKPVIIVGEHRYYKINGSKTPKTQWVCNKWSSKNCRAAIWTIYIAEPRYSMSRGGNGVMEFQNYRYYLKKSKGPVYQWRCNKWSSRGCRGAVWTLEKEIIKLNTNHVH
ncbi:unnamed protein product [Leptidea sinapis]|uniref:FLYWCH-type domain-containing protein n=1 Tax=Leptidea sinapis TaxID=189913 RepID=A0A5E4PX96_9NEOP|nr:unnamed protein product [Leptidea sinapis]